MSSQNSTGRQFDKRHATTVVAQEDISAYRFVTYAGKAAAATTPTAAAPEGAVQGVAEEAAATGDALSVVTDYSYLVEAAGAIAFGAYVKPATGGKATTGSEAEHCGKALGAAAAAGDLIEVQILPHAYTAA